MGKAKVVCHGCGKPFTRVSSRSGSEYHCSTKDCPDPGGITGDLENIVYGSGGSITVTTTNR